MSKFIVIFTSRSEECTFVDTFPAEHPNGPNGFLLKLFEEAEKLHEKLQSSIENKKYNIHYRSFEMFGSSWFVRDLIDRDGSWLEGSFETMTIEEWFERDGLRPGKEQK